MCLVSFSYPGQSCGHPGDISAGAVTPTAAWMFDSYATYQCNSPTLSLVGNSHRKCLGNGPNVWWDGEAPECRGIWSCVPGILASTTTLIKTFYREWPPLFQIVRALDCLQSHGVCHMECVTRTMGSIVWGWRLKCAQTQVKYVGYLSCILSHQHIGGHRTCADQLKIINK